MVEKIILNDTEIRVTDYEEDLLHAEGMESGASHVDRVTVKFDVTRSVYSETAGLLYEGTLNVTVPERNLSFKGEIVNFYSGIVNLYEAEDDTVKDEYTVTFKNIGEQGS